MALGFFQYLFGTGSSARQHLSREEKKLSREDIQRLVSRQKVNTLDQGEEIIVEAVLDKARHGDGKISLFQIDEALKLLQNRHKISINDKKKLMKIFEEHFNKN